MNYRKIIYEKFLETLQNTAFLNELSLNDEEKKLFMEKKREVRKELQDIVEGACIGKEYDLSFALVNENEGELNVDISKIFVKAVEEILKEKKVNLINSVYGTSKNYCYTEINGEFDPQVIYDALKEHFIKENILSTITESVFLTITKSLVDEERELVGGKTILNKAF